MEPEQVASFNSIKETEEQTKNQTAPRFVSYQIPKGVMQYFLKTRGKLHVFADASEHKHDEQSTSAQTNGPELIESYEIAPPIFEPGQTVRNGFVSAEDKIQGDIADTLKRESELKTLRKSQGVLASGHNEDDDNFNGLPALKLNSMARLNHSNELIREKQQARTLAELCDAKEEEVTSPQSLIMQFEQMITGNREMERV